MNSSEKSLIRYPSPITKIEILGLHGFQNISAQFDNSIKILVDENGTGKTTVLYLLVNLLTGKFTKLSRYNFEKISVWFENAQVSVTSEEISTRIDIPLSLRRLEGRIPQKFLLEIIDDASRLPYSQWRRSDIVEMIREDFGISPHRLYEHLSRDRRSSFLGERNYYGHQKSLFEESFAKQENELEQKLNTIRESFPYTILYFPTYRLVEENAKNLSFMSDKPSKIGNHALQFGMTSVEDRFLEITDDIRKSSVEWYSRINGQMLEQLVNGIESGSIDYSSVERPEALSIVLNRIGDNISEENKSAIIDLVSSGQIESSKYTALAYFLSNLIKIYEQQRANDDAIKEFIKVTNSYLDDKQIIYDESKLEIFSINQRTQKRLALEKLSSGEKQIISIFSRLYLGNPKPYAVFFDEPELSLSIEWQKKLLQDIVDSDRCEFLLAATHSPFVFENELAPYADVLNVEYIDELVSEDLDDIEAE